MPQRLWTCPLTDGSGASSVPSTSTAVSPDVVFPIWDAAPAAAAREPSLQRGTRSSESTPEGRKCSSCCAHRVRLRSAMDWPVMLLPRYIVLSCCSLQQQRDGIPLGLSWSGYVQAIHIGFGATADVSNCLANEGLLLDRPIPNPPLNLRWLRAASPAVGLV